MTKQVMIKLVKTYKNGDKVIVEVPEEHVKLLLENYPDIFSHPSKDKTILGKDYSFNIKKEFEEELKAEEDSEKESKFFKKNKG